jgi:NADH:ubiquinone oxidoreductase subunit H
MTPNVTGAGDIVELLGSGFPVQKEAKITLWGSLYRPGRAPIHHQSLEIKGTSVNASKIEIRITDAVQDLVCGKGEMGNHTTFRGDIEVSFPALTPGSLPITGTLRSAILDFRGPAVRKAKLEASLLEGERALKYVGITVASEPMPSGGLLITDIGHESSAHWAGIFPGDTLVSLNGLSLISKADVAPTGRQRFVTFGVRPRGEQVVSEKLVGVQGFKPSGSLDLFGVGLILGLAAAAIMFFMSPLSKLLTWMERTLVARAEASGNNQRDLLVWLLHRVVSTYGRKVRASNHDFVAHIMSEHLVPGQSDVVSLALVAMFTLANLGLAVAGRNPHAKLTVKHVFRRIWQAFSVQLPAILAVLGTILLCSSLRVQDIVRAQGGWPWQWVAFKTPTGTLFFMVFCSAGLMERRTSMHEVPEVEGRQNPEVGYGPSPTPSLFYGMTELLSLFSLSAVATLLFLGAWELPFLDRIIQERSTGYQALGSMFFLAKTWMLVLGIYALRSTLPRFGLTQLTALCWRALIPTSVLGLVFTIGWMYWDPPEFIRRTIALVMFGTSALLVLYFLRRLARAFKTPRLHAHLSPFL